MQRFEGETGIRRSEWYGRFWRNWGEAVAAAGLASNEFQRPYDESVLLERFVDLTRELGRLPTEADLRIKGRVDKAFPCHTSFRRLGTWSDRLRKVVDYCTDRDSFREVVAFLAAQPVESGVASSAKRPRDEDFGSVYLMKSGRYYKIGRSNSVGRREGEIALQLPERTKLVHEIRTDDPAGIEAYWHRRFAERRKNGEWFELTSEDIAAFKRRRFM